MILLLRNFMEELKLKNEILFYFGWVCLISAIVFLVLTKLTSVQVYNVNAWYKPFKFAISTVLFAWAMAWYCSYLPNFNSSLFGWSTVVLLGFEILYIAIQAGRGQLSHYNNSTPLNSFLFMLMALAATLVTLYTAYIAILFFIQQFPNLPNYYVWAIRCSLVLFVIFSFEGFLMGAQRSHTLGGPDGGPGIPVLNWSTQFGDPRIAHFIGMHALQVLPLLSYYVLKNVKATLFVSLCYAALAVFTLVQALQGKPLFAWNKQSLNQQSDTTT
jgi:hypothetical protein